MSSRYSQVLLNCVLDMTKTGTKKLKHCYCGLKLNFNILYLDAVKKTLTSVI